MEFSLLKALVACCLLWTAWYEYRQGNPRDARFACLIAVVLFIGSGMLLMLDDNLMSGAL